MSNTPPSPDIYKNKKKHKPPSVVRRNRERAQAYREKKVHTNCVCTQGEPDPQELNQKEKLQNSKTKISLLTRFFKRGEHEENAASTKQHKVKEVKDITKREAPSELKVENHSPSIIDPNRLYENIEINMKLSRLEEVVTLGTALRHVIRLKHTNGQSITFPSPEAVDRIQLKSHGLPKDVGELLELLEKAFKRRNEVLDLEEVYRDVTIFAPHLVYAVIRTLYACDARSGVGCETR